MQSYYPKSSVNLNDLISYLREYFPSVDLSNTVVDDIYNSHSSPDASTLIQFFIDLLNIFFDGNISDYTPSEVGLSSYFRYSSFNGHDYPLKICVEEYYTDPSLLSGEYVYNLELKFYKYDISYNDRICDFWMNFECNSSSVFNVNIGYTGYMANFNLLDYMTNSVVSFPTENQQAYKLYHFYKMFASYIPGSVVDTDYIQNRFTYIDINNLIINTADLNSLLCGKFSLLTKLYGSSNDDYLVSQVAQGADFGTISGSGSLDYYECTVDFFEFTVDIQVTKSTIISEAFFVDCPYPTIIGCSSLDVSDLETLVLKSLDYLLNCCAQIKNKESGDEMDYTSQLSSIAESLQSIDSKLSSSDENNQSITDVIKNSDGNTNLVQIDEACPPFGRNGWYR